MNEITQKMSEDLGVIRESLAAITTKIDYIQEAMASEKEQLKRIEGRVTALENFQASTKGGRTAILIALSVLSGILGIATTILAFGT